MKQGALIFDERSDRYDIRFDLADYYGGLHCGETLAIRSISRPASTSKTRKATMLTKANGRFLRIPMRPSSTRKPLTMCSAFVETPDATRMALGRPIP